MPRRYITEIIHQLKGWTGINTREHPLTIGPKDMQDCQNFDIGLHGELVKRTGFATVHAGATLGANPVQILGFFNTNTAQQLIARAGTNLYYSTDGVAWTIIPGGPWGNVEWGVQYITNFYMVRRDAVMLQWDGAACTAIAGSPFGSYCKVFKDRLFVLNSYAVGRIASRLYFSNPFDFSSTGWPAINYVGVSEGDGDVLTCVFDIRDHLLVFKSGATWKLYVQGSDITSWILRPFSAEVGCISRSTVVQYEGSVYLCSAKGVYHTDGNSLKIMSNTITNLWDSVVVSSTTINNHSAFMWKDKYFLALETYPTLQLWSAWSGVSWSSLATTPWSGTGQVYQYLCFHVRVGGWTEWAPTGVRPHTFVTVALNATLKGVYCGERSATGFVYKYGDPIYRDNGVSYLSSMTTREEDAAEPGQLKRGKWTAIEAYGGGTITVQHIINGQAQASASYTVPGSAEEFKVAGPGHFRSWAMLISQNQAQPLTVHGLAVVMQIGYGERRPIKTAV